MGDARDSTTAAAAKAGVRFKDGTKDSDSDLKGRAAFRKRRSKTRRLLRTKSQLDAAGEGGEENEDDDTEDFGEDSSEEQDSSEAEEKLRKEKSRASHKAMWRKAAVIVSFRRRLFGDTMKALQDAVDEVSQAAVASGHAALELPSWSDEPAEMAARTARKRWTKLRSLTLLGAAAAE